MKTETIDLKMTGLKRLISKYLWRMDVEKPSISLTPAALVFLYNNKTDYTTIPWSEITELKYIKDDMGYVIYPVVKDPQPYIDACTSKIIRFGMKKSMDDEGSPFGIRVDSLNYSPDQIATLMEEYLKENGAIG